MTAAGSGCATADAAPPDFLDEIVHDDRPFRVKREELTAAERGCAGTKAPALRRLEFEAFEGRVLAAELGEVEAGGLDVALGHGEGGVAD